jgi:hypothetical protein
MYDAFTGNANTAKTYGFTIKSIRLINTGAATATVTVGSVAVAVPAGQTFDELVIPTKAFSIAATDNFVCYVRADG